MFSNTSPRHSFFEGPSANLTSKARFGSHLRPQIGAIIRPWTDIFYPKGRLWSSTFSRGEHPGADLAAIWCRKGPKYHLQAIFGPKLQAF